MDKGLLPRRYAKALYKFATEKKQSETVYKAMRNILAAFETNRELRVTISNPFVSEHDKASLIDSAAGMQNSVLEDFVKLLAQNNRLDIMREAALAYTTLYRQENNIHLVHITSAAPLSDADKKRLTDMIEKHIDGATAEFSFEVNPDLIGGFVVKLDNESLDASVRNQLDQLRQSLITK
ncbi:MAG: ATP synthase F1 subunit delta [Muribaculaceae bacterium]|nr:ATP synthase F1 subunit delta [Muribaculaceae bacterium]